MPELSPTSFCAGLGLEARAALGAVRFFTRLPWPGPATGAEELSRAVGWFPLGGFVVGLLGAGVWWLALLLWTGPVAAAVTVLLVAWLTGAMHEDGLADTADGLGGGSTLEKKLAIMKDSRTGAYGVVAIVGAFAIRIMALGELSAEAGACLLVVAHVLARWNCVLLLRALPYLSGPASRNQAVAVRPSLPRTAWATLLAVVFVAFPLVLAVRWAGLPANVVPLCWGVTLIVGVGAARMFRSMLGGVTGDTLGATALVTELAILLVGTRYAVVC
jgi:adenosylcobinamide-GDP ribazoletransferase